MIWSFFKIIPGVPKTTEQQTKEAIPGLAQTPLTQPPMPGQIPQIPGLNAPTTDTTQTTQFSQNQLRGQTPLLGQQQLPSPLVPPPLPPSPFGSQMGQKPMMPMPGLSVSDNGAGSLRIETNQNLLPLYKHRHNLILN